MDSRNRPDDPRMKPGSWRSLRLPLLASLLLHAAFFALLVGPLHEEKAGSGRTATRLEARLNPPIRTDTPPGPSAPRPPARPGTQPTPGSRQLALADAPWASRSWSDTERKEMNDFLGQPAAKPLSGWDLAQNALAQAGRTESRMAEAAGAASPPPPAIEAFSLEMYFDAFVRKLNRSAAFVSHERTPSGFRKALLAISLNPDGSLKDFRILHAADQAGEIAYVRAVLERAAPFAAFPQDIRNATDSLSLLMCITPSRDGEGAGFSRSSNARDCRD